MIDLNPERPEDFGAAYQLIRDELARKVVGHTQAIQALALAGTRHWAGEVSGWY